MLIFLVLGCAALFPTLALPDAPNIARFPPAYPPPSDNTMNYNGKKMPRREGTFSVIGVKIDDAGKGRLAISVYFNDAVDTNSIFSRHIFIDDEPIPQTTEFLFNKSRRMMRFTIARTTDTFSFAINHAQSFDGRQLKQVALDGLEPNCFFKYERGGRGWQKSSL